VADLVFITGAAKRIGRELALHYSRKGWHVAVHHYRSLQEALELRHEAEASRGKISLFQADFCKPGSVENLFGRVVRECGIPRLLINNASVFEKDELLLREENLAAHMAVNAFTPIRLTQELATRSSSPALSVILGDATLEAAWKSDFTSYRASRAAVSNWVKTAAPSLLPKLRLYELLLGPTWRNDRESEVHFSTRAALTRSGKPTSVETIAKTIDQLVEKPCTEPLIDLS
jgi:NAD(P)-dependent dehydrogenase (short-subunit alcohol dehydrogenase family)